MSRIKEINVSDLFHQIGADNNLELVDIRTATEINRGVLPNATILAMYLVPLKIDYFSASSRQFVIYCRTGSRSAQVCRFLNQQGIFNVISLRGGVVKWVSGGYPLDYTPGDIDS